ncbi:hypothetical protein PG995_007280 [Apiospora arundinis]
MSYSLPSFFIGDRIQVNQNTIEHQILFAKRPKATGLQIGLMQSNLILIFQALHRTQQHRLQYHPVAEDVAAVLGFEGTEGANAVARIIDHYCAARLAFHRQNNEYHFRQLLHVLVDEEIRWRLERGSNSQILDPRRNQPQAKNHYAAETKMVIETRFHDLMRQELPSAVRGQPSPRNKHFGVLKGINLSQPMPPMRAMESGVDRATFRKIDPKKYSVTTFIEQYNAKKAAEAEKAANAETAAQSSTKTSAADTAEAASAPASSPSPVLDKAEEDGDKDVAEVPSEEDKDDVAMPEPPAPLPVNSASDGSVHTFTDEQVGANELRRAAEEAAADQHRKDQQTIAALQAEIAGFKRAQEQWAHGLTTIKDERDRLASENPALRQENERLEKRAEDLNMEVTALERAYKDALKRIDALEDEKEADGRLFRADVAAYQVEVEAYMANHYARRQQEQSPPAGPAGAASRGDQE